MKKVFIIAYSCLNLGDDLFIRTLVRRYPQTEFWLYTGLRYKVPFASEPNLKCSSTFTYFTVAALKKLKIFGRHAEREYFAKKLHNVVRIGGSIFIEPPNWSSGGDLSRKSSAVNTFYIGANFGPYRSEGFLRETRDRIRDAQDCCFRDSASFALFQDMPSVRLAPDVLFGYPYYPQEKTGNGIGISVISLESRRDLKAMKDEYYKTIADVCLKCQQKEIPVTLFAFCKQEGDVHAIEDILSQIKDRSGIEACVYNGDLDSFMNKLNECEYMLATRFHAMVLGWSMGKKVLPIVYSHKQTNVIQDIGFSGRIWNLLGGEKYDGSRLLNDCLENPALEIGHLKLDAQKQFEALDLFLKADET